MGLKVHEAAYTGDVKRLKAAVNARNVNTINDKDGWSALHYGAWAGWPKVVEALLLEGADPSLQDKAGRTALHLAALGGWSAAVNLLCRHGASVHARDRGGRTPLTFAASCGHWKAITWLMSWGADSSIHMPSGQGATAQQGNVAHKQSSMQSAQEAPMPSDPHLPGVLGSGHGDEGTWGAPDPLLASRSAAPQLLQHHQQDHEQDMVHDSEDGVYLRNTASHSRQEADALADALSSLGLHPGHPAPGHRVFRLDDLRKATNNFASENEMRGGSHWSNNTTRYRGELPGTSPGDKAIPVAVSRGSWICSAYIIADRLAKLQHPNILPLLGFAVQSPRPNLMSRIGLGNDPKYYVYPLMQNGSLEDALRGRRADVRKGGLPAPVQLDWRARTRIAAEVAAGLLHVHGRPRLLTAVHGRLQPSTILLGEGLTAKLGDTSLDTYRPPQAEHYTAPELYELIDERYGRKSDNLSDIYSFGVVLLRLLVGYTCPAFSPQRLAEKVPSGNLVRLLDPRAGAWPLEEATELYRLALRCTARRPESRPSLETAVLPALRRLAERAKSHGTPASSTSANGDPPTMLVCPITQVVMTDPVVSADGYTYERGAIEQWLSSGHDTSPVTKLRLAHTQLTPNHTLRSAGREWLAAHRKV